jgi:hypothetical protein
MREILKTSLFTNYLSRLFILSLLILIGCKGDSGVSIDSEGGLSDVSIAISSGNNQFTAINEPFADPLVIQLSGSSISGVPIYFQTVNNSVPVTLSSSSVYTDDNGRAQITVDAKNTAGLGYVQAKLTLAGREKAVRFKLNINGAATDWGITQVGGSASVSAGETFQIRLRALLFNGNADTNFSGNKYLEFTTTNDTSPGGNAPSLPANGNYSFTNGVIDSDLDITFYDSSENNSDTFTITVSGSSLNAGTMDAIEVSDEEPNSVRIVNSATCSATEILDASFAVPSSQTIFSRYYDVYGNCIEAIDADSSWTKAFLDTQLTFDSSTSGVNSIDFTPVQGAISEATAFSITDTTYAFTDSTGTVSLTSGSASQFLITGLDSNGNYTTDAGTTVELLIEARDVFGNLAVDYTGSKTLNFTTTATATTPPTGSTSAQSPDIPTSGGTYTFTNGILTAGDVDVTFFRANETPTIYVEDTNDNSINGTTAPITVSLTAHTYTRVRDTSSNNGNITGAKTLTADQSETFHCATYDSHGNYIQDDSTADWTYDGVITAGELTTVTDASSLTYTPSNVGTGSVTCNSGGITDNSGTYTIVPGTPVSIAIADGGTTNFATNFSETAGTDFSAFVRLYDTDGNHADNFNNDIDLNFSFIGSVAVDTSIPSEITPTITSAKVNNTNSTSETITISFSSGDATVNNFMLYNDAAGSDRVKIQVDDADSTYDITTAQSGLIAVGDGALAFISLRDAASNGGNVINANTLTNDDDITLYAAGYDASGNYISEQSVTWSTTAGTSSCTDGDLSSTSGTSITYSPSSTGTCTITADAGSSITDTSGAISSSNGVADSFSITLLGGGSTVTAGENFGLRITILDADGNRVFNYTPATTYSITNTLTNSPEGTSPDTWTAASGDFVFGEALLFPVKAYNAQTFTVTVTETVGGTGMASTSNSFTVNPETLDHYATQNGSGTYTADGTTTFSIDLEARDEYGNATTTGITSNTVNSITAVYSSGDETTVNSIGGFTNFTFGGGSAVETISNLTYDVSHEVEFVVADSAGITTPSGQRLSATFTPSDAGIARYEIFNISDTTPTAGDVMTAQIRALDNAGNIITDGATDNVDSALNGYTFSITLGSSANDSEYGDSPSITGLGAITFTDGVSSTFNMTFYNDETVLGTDIDVSDGVGSVGDAGSNDITVSVDSLDHYSNDTVSGGSIAGDGTTTFAATINARDQYGNIVAGDSSITLTAVPQDGHTVGTLGGTKVLNMTSGTTTVSDLTYNAAGSLKLGSSGGTVSIDNVTAGRSTVYSFDSDIGAVDNYLVQIPDGTSVTAGDNTYRVQITARDSSNNTVDDAAVDAALSARSFTVSGFGESPEGTAFSPAAGFTWSAEVSTGQEANFTNGVATIEITPVKAETVSSFTVTDGSGISGTYNTGDITVSPAAFNKIVIAGASTGVADGNSGSPTDYTATVTGRDSYGNLTVAPGATGYTALVLTAARISGAANTGTVTSNPATIDLTSNSSTTVNVNYNIAHTTRFNFSNGSATSDIDTNLTPIVTWAVDSSAVTSYTLTANDTSTTASTQITYKLTAFDAGGNQIIGEDTTLNGISFDFSATGADCDAPNKATTSIEATVNGTAFASASAVTANGINGGFSNGVWNIPVTFYNTNANCGAIGFLDITDTDNTINVTSTNAVNVGTSTGYYVSTAVSGFPQDADNNRKNTTSLTATLYDQYGNEKSNSSISGTYLSIQKISGYGSSNGTVYACGPTGGGAAANYGDGCTTPVDLTTINLDFDGTATQTIYDLSYDVGNTIEIRFNDGSGVTTEVTAASAEDFSLNTVTGTVGSYTFVNPAGPITSGVSANWTVTALDRAGNTITGIDTDLDGMSLSITDETSGDFDAPDSSNNWTDSIGNFSSGISTVAMTIYSDQDVANADFTLVDSTNSINTSNSGGTVTVNSETNCDRFTVSANNLASSPDADGNAIANTDATISCVDTYGNLTSYSGVNTIRLDIVHVPDGSTYGATEGTLQACSDSDGNGCGSPSDITTQTLDFSSPTQTRTIHDLSYEVGHDLYIRAYEDGGTIDTASGDSPLIEWEAVAGTIDRYTLTPVSPSTNAGSVTSWEIRAYDAANNQMTNENGLNDAILTARSFTVSETAAGSGNMDGPTSTSVSLPSGANITFSSGVGTLSGADGLTFYHSDNDVQTNYLELQDELSNIGTLTAGMLIDPEGIGAKFEVTASGTFPADATNDETADTDTEITITLYDQYGNETTDSTVNNASITPSIQTSDATYTNTGTLKLCGAASADANNGDGCATPLDFSSLTYDFTSSTSQLLYDLSYDVTHDIKFILNSTARGGITTATGDSADLSWNATSKIVNSYTLTFDDANVTAGSSTDLSLTAYDSAGNIISTEDTILDNLTFDFSNTGSVCDAPNSASTSIVGAMDGTAFTSATNINASSVNGGFSSGIWSIPVTLYNTSASCGAINFVDIDETGNSLNVKSSDAISVNTSTAYYVSTTTTGFPQDADNNAKTSTSVTATLYDQYGNEKSDSTISGTFLSLNKISGYGSSDGTVYACGPTGVGAAANYGDGCTTPIDLTTITLDFDGTSTQTIYDLSYDVGNVIEIRFDNSAGVTTQISTAASAQDITWNTVTGTVGSYTFVNPAGPLTSGVAANWVITALDRAGNTITGIDTDLDGMSLSITDETGGDFDAPDSSNNWSRSIDSFSSGVANASMTLYSDQDVANGDFTLVDATNSINTSNSGGATTVNSESNCDRFTVSTNNLSGSPDADGNAILNTDATISCVDSYGNLTSYSGGNTIRLDIVHVTDAQAYGSTEGTLLACTYIADDACGSPTDVTTHTLDFSSPNQQRTIHDLSYNIGHDLYIRAYEDGGTIDTAESDSTRIEWEAVAGTIDSYAITPVSGSANAGSVTSWEVRAYDAANNQMTNENGLNDTILSARDLTIVETGAGSGNMNGPTSGSVSLPSAVNLTFSSGVGTFSAGNGLTFYHSDNDVQSNYLQIQDELSNTGSQTAGMNINPEGVGAKFEVTATGTFPANATNDDTADADTEITITLYDQYGNETTDSTVNNASITPSLNTSDVNYSTTGTMKACGPGSSDANNGDVCSTPLAITALSYDFTSTTTQSLYDLSYDVAHDVEVIIDSTARGGITTAAGDSADLTWNATSKIVNSYTLTFDDTTATAGSTTNLSLTAFDKAGNVLDQAATDSTLEGISFNFSATADNDAPTSGDTVANNDPANGSSFTFNSGVASIPYIFYKDRNILGSADEITITDENSVSVTPDNADSIDINPNTPVDLVFTTSAHTTTAGDCSSAVTIETRDTYGNPSNVTGDQNITLGEDSDMTFYSDATCDTSIGTTATILNGTSSVTFYYEDTNDGTTSLSLTSSFNDPSAQSHTITPDTAVNLVFTTSTHTTVAGECSDAVTIETRDTYGNPSNVTGDQNITLGENSDMTFYSDATCDTSIGTTATVADGTSSATFYYEDTNDGTTTITLSSSYNDPSGQDHTISPNTAVNLVFTTSAHTTVAGECSNAVTLETRDTHGNTSNVSGDLNVTLSGVNGAMTFYSDATCDTSIGTTATVSNGTSSVTFYYKDTNDGTTDLTLSSSYNDPAAQSQTITPNTAVNLVFTTSAHTTTAGICSAAVTVETRDTHGNTSNVASDLTVTLGEDSDMVFYTNNDCSSATTSNVTISSGTSSETFYYIDTNDGTTNLSLSSSYNDPLAQAHTIQPNTADDLVFVTSGHTTVAGECSSLVTIESRDTYGNDANVVGNLNVSLSGDNGGAITFYDDVGCLNDIGTTVTITSGSNSTGFYYVETNDGTTNISLSSTLDDPSAQAQTITPNTAEDLFFTSSAHSTVAGVCSAAVTIETLDTHGNASNVGSDLTVNLTEDSDMVFYSNNDCSSGAITSVTVTSGTSTADFYYIDTNDGTTNITLGSTFNDPSAQAHTITPDSPVNLIFTSSGHTVAAGDCSSAVTIETQDTHGNTSNVSGDTVVTLGKSSGTMTFYENSNCTGPITQVTISNGTSGATYYYSDTNDDSPTINLSSSLNDPSAQTQTITPNTATNLHFVTSALTESAGDCSGVVTIETRDTHGNDSNVTSDLSVSLSADTGTMTFFTDVACTPAAVTSVTIPNGSNSVNFYFKETAAGTSDLSLSSTLIDPTAQLQTINHNTLASLSWSTETVANQVINTDFQTAGVVSATDVHGNPITDTTPTIVLSKSLNSDCSSDDTTNLSNNTANVSAGSASFANVQLSSSGGPYYFKASLQSNTSINTCTTGSSSVYAVLASSPASGTVSALGTETFEFTGGVPSLTCNDLVTDNSGANITSSCYTGGCAGDVCIDYTAGAQGNVTDQIRVTDSLGTQLTVDITVNGANFSASAGAYTFPGGDCGGGGTSTTITIANNGNVNATSLSRTITGDSEISEGASFNCGTTDTGINTGGADTCNIEMNFDGSSGTFSTDVTIEDTTNGGKVTVQFDASCP